MAGYRQFHTKFWKDDWLIDLEPLERYLFSYLFTNDLSSISGLYKLPFRVIINETGLDKAFVEKALAKFQDAKKIFYKDGVMWVVKMKQYHKNASPTTMTKVNADVAEIPDCDVKTAYLYYNETGIYSIDMVWIHTQRSLSESLNLSLNGSKSESASDSPDPFSTIQHIIQTNIGIPPAGEADTKAILELVSLQATEADIQDAIAWINGTGKTVRYYSSLVGPTKTAITKRKQNGRAHAPTTPLPASEEY